MAVSARPEDDPSASRAAWALWGTLIALTAARLVLAFIPSMWGWGLNLHRFLHPAVAWAPWIAATAALFPPVARRAAVSLGQLGDALARRPVLFAWTAAALAAMFVAMFPDRTRFVGDFLLRQGTVEQSAVPAQLFPQALVLDVFLHATLPRALTSAGFFDANGAARLLGAFEAAALAALAVAFARALDLRGIPAATAAAVVFFGGHLGMFTGFGKAFAELVLVVTALGVAGIRVIRSGRGLMSLGLAFAAGLALHRSALGTLPAVVLVWAWWWRERGTNRVWRTPRVLAALAVPVVALAVMLPHIIAVMRRWDALHVASAEVRSEGGPLSAAFAGARLPDMLNLVVFLAPLAAAAIPMMLALGAARLRRREFAMLAALTLPLVLALMFVHPAQGLYRDWDDFAALGAALSLVAAWLVAWTLRAAPRLAWIGVPVVLAVAVPGTQWLAHWADVDRGLERVEAFMREPPARTVTERSTTWDFLGIRNLRLGRLDAAVAAFTQSAGAAPSPRILLELGYAERSRGNLPGAQRAFRRLVERDSTTLTGWEVYGSVSAQLGDTLAVRQAVASLRRHAAGNRTAAALETWLGSLPRTR